jgi:hypothetical protein
MRTPVYELHIRPLMRLMDREGMAWSFDLFEYDQVVQHAEQIADRAAVDMPPVAKGGPWPSEFVALFRRWMATGYKRLELGVGDYSWVGSVTGATVSAKGVYPQAGYKGWLQVVEDTATTRTYCLYFEAPDEPQAGEPSTFAFKDKYKRTNNPQVFIQDLHGTQQVH